ncbi:P-loop containing nucleoside triphosphate hydrolase protein, partial [Mycena olivaceomarginata]
MPSLSNTVEKILKYTTAAANALQDVPAATQMPFVQRICGLTLMIVPMVQNTKAQKDRCFRIVEGIHHLLCVLMDLSMHSEDLQSPMVLNYIAQFALTLQKIDSCLRAQQQLGIFKRLFSQSELITQLDSCEMELKATLSSFTMKHGITLALALVEFSSDTERRHQEFLELLSSQSGSFDSVSSIGRRSLNASSGSFSLLPAFPKIFHGRDSELEALVNTLLKEPARIAILGPGGMGKTTLAVAALHKSEVVGKYPNRHFIPCDSAQTNESLVATIGAGLGLEATHATAKHIVHHLATGPPCLVILDNFETPWEPMDGRAKVEGFLSLLADISHLALLITMRGAERPGKVQWTHPFLCPLVPLSRVAAHQAFIEIADDIHNNSEVDQLLDITDNIPLAVQLIASIADSEGCGPTLERWKLEKTAMLSDGTNKRSNLEHSIQLSLSSPRMVSSPYVVELLRLMSLLSDGISDLDLMQSRSPIPEILRCKATLLRTSLAYVDHAGRLKVLAPIREYIQNTQPPSPRLVLPLQKHFIEL